MRIAALTGIVEEACIGAAEAGLPARRALNALLVGCVEGIADEAAAEALSIGRREALALAIRAAAIEGPMRARLRCEACGEALDLSLPPLDLVSEGGAEAELALEDVRLGCRAVTAADQAAVAHLADDPEAAAAALLARCVTVLQGPADVAGLPRHLREAAAARLFEIDPMAETLLSTACPACGVAVRGSLDAGAFLVAEIARRGAALSREVLLIARATGWSEAAILALPRRRRQRYAELLGAEAAP